MRLATNSSESIIAKRILIIAAKIAAVIGIGAAAYITYLKAGRTGR